MRIFWNETVCKGSLDAEGKTERITLILVLERVIRTLAAWNFVLRINNGCYLSRICECLTCTIAIHGDRPYIGLAIERPTFYNTRGKFAESIRAFRQWEHQTTIYRVLQARVTATSFVGPTYTNIVSDWTWPGFTVVKCTTKWLYVTSVPIADMFDRTLLF